MADELDRASLEIEALLESQLYLARKKRNNLLPSGFCNYCDSDVTNKLLFCDKDCATDYETEQRIYRKTTKRL